MKYHHLSSDHLFNPKLPTKIKTPSIGSGIIISQAVIYNSSINQFRQAYYVKKADVE